MPQTESHSHVDRDRQSVEKDGHLDRTDERTTAERCSMPQAHSCGDRAPQNAEKDVHLECFGARHIVALLCFLGVGCMYSMRVNLYVAIVAMVNNTRSAVALNYTEKGECPFPEDYDPEDNVYPSGEFDWDESTQGLILGSFYYGYFGTCFLGGLAAERWGGYLVMGIGMLFNALFTLLFPLATKVSFSLLIAVQILGGLAQGVTLPAITFLIARWYPTKERLKFTGLIFSGIQFGTVVTMPITGWLCATEFLGGWPASFYVFGFLGFIWGMFWFLLVRDTPKQHPRISENELKYIAAGCPDLNKRAPVPWGAILTSRYFWVIAAVHFGDNWGFYTLLSELPTYFDQILHVNIKNNGMISAMPYLGSGVFCVVLSLVTGRLIARGSLSILFVRRLAAAIGGFGPMLGLIAMCFVKCNRSLAFVVLIVSGSMNGAVNLGHTGSHVDISPRFSGTLMGMTNTLATIPGFLAPVVTGTLTDGNQTLYAWRKVFLISALIFGITTTIYMVFITAEVQPWNEVKPDKEVPQKQNSGSSSIISRQEKLTY